MLKCAALCNNNNNNNNNSDDDDDTDLTIEIELTWHIKTKVKPVIIGANGTISKSFRKYPGKIPGKHKIKELQKTGTHTSKLLM